MRPDTSNFDALLRPASVAVLGASEAPGKLGGAPLRIMQAYGYGGRLLPINPKGGTILGLPAYPTLADVSGEIDLAVVAIPAQFVLQAIEDCAARGVRAAVVFSSGFGEIDDTGSAAQNRIAEVARAAGMRLVGPNCLGVVNLEVGLAATFCPFFLPRMAPGGSIGMISQSGAFGGYVANLAAQRGLSFSSWITTGNEGDVDIADAIAYQAGDAATRVILVYVEGVRDGGKLLSALELARAARKPVIVLKVGRTEEGAAAAASHTGSLAGADEIYDAALRQHGAYRAHSIGEWFDLGYAFAKGVPPANREIGIVTVSGGVGVMMADEAIEGGLITTPLSEAAQASIRQIVPFAAARNPIDMTGAIIADVARFGDMLDIVLSDRSFGSLVSFNAGAGLTLERGAAIFEAWKRARARDPDTHISIAGAVHPEVRARFEEIGCLSFMEPDTAIRIASAMRTIVERHDILPADLPGIVPTASIGSGNLTEIESMALVAAAGLPVTPQHVATTADEAAEHARRLGFPVVVKILSPEITHKSDIGGVALNLKDEAAVRKAFTACLTSARDAAPEARLDSCLVAPMVAQDGIETILGVTIDPVFGPVVMFGLGGVFVEVLKDVSFRIAPFGEDEARRMIGEVRGSAVLHGARGRAGADIDAVAAALSRLSLFAHANRKRLISMDINPFLAKPPGQGAIALDALVIAR